MTRPSVSAHFSVDERADDYRPLGSRPLRLAGGLVLVLVGCLAVAGCVRAPAQQPTMPIPAVTVSYPLERELADYAEFTGQTAAVKSVDVRARVWGFLQSVNFTEGALVKKGDLLFQIDPRPYQALVNQAQSKIAQDQAQLKHNDALYERIQKLRSRGAATQEDLDKALADRDSIQATLMADTADLEAMGRAGAARVAERHNVAIEVKKLADLISRPTAHPGEGNPHTLPAPVLTTR